jgi:hypothetical protein
VFARSVSHSRILLPDGLRSDVVPTAELTAPYTPDPPHFYLFHPEIAPSIAVVIPNNSQVFTK